MSHAGLGAAYPENLVGLVLIAGHLIHHGKNLIFHEYGAMFEESYVAKTL